MAEIAYLYLQETSIQFAGMVDDAKEGKHFFGINIRSLNELQELSFDAILITDIAHKNGAQNSLLHHGVYLDQVIKIS